MRVGRCFLVLTSVVAYHSSASAQQAKNWEVGWVARLSPKPDRAIRWHRPALRRGCFDPLAVAPFLLRWRRLTKRISGALLASQSGGMGMLVLSMNTGEC